MSKRWTWQTAGPSITCSAWDELQKLLDEGEKWEAIVFHHQVGPLDIPDDMAPILGEVYTDIHDVELALRTGWATNNCGRQCFYFTAWSNLRVAWIHHEEGVEDIRWVWRHPNKTESGV